MEQTAIVAGVIGVAGTLLGVGLGSWLSSRSVRSQWHREMALGTEDLIIETSDLLWADESDISRLNMHLEKVTVRLKRLKVNEDDVLQLRMTAVEAFTDSQESWERSGHEMAGIEVGLLAAFAEAQDRLVQQADSKFRPGARRRQRLRSTA